MVLLTDLSRWRLCGPSALSRWFYVVLLTPFQVSWMSEGLEQVIKKLMGPKGFFTHRNSLFDLLARTKRGTSAEAMIGDIFKKVCGILG